MSGDTGVSETVWHWLVSRKNKPCTSRIDHVVRVFLSLGAVSLGAGWDIG
jgi:hypothetical protein